MELERNIAKLIPLWRAEEMEKLKDKYDETILTARVDEYREVHVRVIGEILKLKESVLVLQLEQYEWDVDGTMWEWILTPMQQNFINIILYIYYLFVCCRDSIFIYNILYAGFWFDRTGVNLSTSVEQPLYWYSNLDLLDTNALQMYYLVTDHILYLLI